MPLISSAYRQLMNNMKQCYIKKMRKYGKRMLNYSIFRYYHFYRVVTAFQLSTSDIFNMSSKWSDYLILTITGKWHRVCTIPCKNVLIQQKECSESPSAKRYPTRAAYQQSATDYSTEGEGWQTQTERKRFSQLNRKMRTSSQEIEMLKTLRNAKQFTVLHTSYMLNTSHTLLIEPIIYYIYILSHYRERHNSLVLG